MDNKIKEYFSSHKLSPTGIRNFLCYTNGVREWIENKIRKNPEYETPGGYISCLLKNIKLPKCKNCQKTISYKSYKNGCVYCSFDCFKSNINEERKKTIKTIIEKYGADNCSKVEKFKEKRKQTMIERYGVENITQNKDYAKKVRQTMIERYGETSYTKTEKYKKYWYKKSWNNTISKWSDFVVPLFKFEEYKGYKHGEEYNWKCVKCGNEFLGKITPNSYDKSFGRMPRCFNCFPLVKKSSRPEKEIKEFINSFYDGEIILNSSEIIYPLEIDIYIPDKKVAIEFNGLFYHNDKSNKKKKYHCIKSSRCERKGIFLFHIFEDEWENKKDLVKNRIKNLLGICEKRIFARNCKVSEISLKDKNIFLKENDFSGEDVSSVKIGLYYKNELISVMTFSKSQKNNNIEYKMNRFCNKGGCIVVGGASKMLKYFEEKFKPSLITAKCDRRCFKGNLFYKLGFKFLKLSQPKFYWKKNKNRLMKNIKLKKITNNCFDDNLSIETNMRKNGWKKIYDCGDMIFQKKI